MAATATTSAVITTATASAVVPKKAPIRINFFIDYKSPFSYLAIEPTYQLMRDFGDQIDVKWYPYAFSVDKLFGLPDARNDVNWRKVKYLYVDVRRHANARVPPLTILGPTKAYESSIALAAGMYAQEIDAARDQSSMILSSGYKNSRSSFVQYTDMVFERFFTRRLDIEDHNGMRDVLRTAFTLAETTPDCNGVLTTAQVNHIKQWTHGFDIWYETHGKQRVNDIAKLGDKQGLFGVPAYVVLDNTPATAPSSAAMATPARSGSSNDDRGELFFGQDRIDWVRRRLVQLGAIDRSVKQPIKKNSVRARL